MSAVLDPDAPEPKAPPPGLSARADRPRAVRLRRSAVRIAALGGAAVVAGALAWAFVIQPELRAEARAASADRRDNAAGGAVRPAETVTEQPAAYDRLPPPRLASPASEPVDEVSSAGGRSHQALPTHAPPPRATRTATSRDAARASNLFFASSPQASATPVAAAAQDTSERRSGAALRAGTIIPAVLLNAIDTSRPGPVVAAVTENVFDSLSGRRLIVPQGARLLGAHDGDSAYGDRRAFLVWKRLLLPDGRSLDLADAPGVDAQGAMGAPGRAERRLGALATATLFGAAVSTLGQAARSGGGGGLLGDAGDAAAIQGALTGGRLVERELQVRPSIRLEAGAPIRVLITQDLEAAS